MYRYLLFHCYYYYPGGGMRDCALKTNNIDELVPFIEKHYEDDLLYHIHYYDTVEDKMYRAVMEEHYVEDYRARQKFIRWEIADGNVY